MINRRGGGVGGGYKNVSNSVFQYSSLITLFYTPLAV